MRAWYNRFFIRQTFGYCLLLSVLSGCLSEVDSNTAIDDSPPIAEPPPVVEPPPPPAATLSVSDHTPQDGGTADSTAPITVTFTAAVDSASVNNDSLVVSDQQGPIAGTVSVNDDSLIFTPTASMEFGMLHSVEVADSVASTDGASLESLYFWSFTTSFGDAAPELAALEATMVEQGNIWGMYMDPNGPNSQNDKYSHQFYDSGNSFQRISEHLGQAEPWLTYANWSNQVFRNYLVDNGYNTQGYRRTTLGFAHEFMNGGPASLSELEMLRDIPPYSRVAEGRNQGGSEHRSRPIALALQANVHAEQGGSPRVLEDGAARLATFIPWIGSHLYEWRTADYRGTPDVGLPRFSPFMFGLTTHSLIYFIEWERENGRDPNAYWRQTYPMDYGQGTTPGVATVTWPTIVDAMADVATWAVEEATHELDPSIKMWVPDNLGYASFYYSTVGQTDTLATDLNLFAAHTYAWLWKETGDRRFRDWGDQLFGAGARNSNRAARNDGKHFNQQFRMSFDFLKWRAEGDQIWADQLN